jgi:hypothetical protein
MPSWLKHFLFILFLVVFAGCAGSCSGCAGCGVTPLNGGFPNAERVENSSSLRVTDTGLQFISQNLSSLAPALLGDSASGTGGVLTFAIPSSSQSVGIGGVDVCPNGPNPNANPPTCTAEVDLGKANLTIGTKAPHNLTVTGTLAVRLRSLPVKGTGLLFWVNCEAVLDNGAVCNPRDYVNVPVNVDISLEADTNPAHAARQGYTKVRIVTINIDQATIENSITFCGGFDATIVNALSGLLIGSFIGGLTDTIQSTVEEQLCAKEDPAAGVTCPTGTYPDSGGTCRYCQPNGSGQCADSSAECVAISLGVDGNINLEAFLQSISPGTKGGFDFLAALGGEGIRDDGSNLHWGDLNPIGGGMTIGMMGGAIPQPVSQCVPTVALEKPTGIPIPDELLGNTVPNWTGTGPHFGAAVSERYMNYVLGSTYNSGALCLGIGPSALGSAGALLNSDTIGLLIPSFKDLARQKQKAPLALMIRPQSPPSLTVGKGTDLAVDPLLNVKLDKFNIDFYLWSSDRFMRAFTASFDIVAPVNLDVTEQSELVPVINEVVVNNPQIFNADLLREDEAAAADALAGIVAGQVGSALGGAIGPISLNDLVGGFGLTLTIPPTVAGQGSPGLTKLEKGTDRFLGLFASFGTAAPAGGNMALELETTAKVREKSIDPAGLSLPTITRENRPVVELELGSPQDNGSRAVEYQYRLDRGFWKPWTRERFVKLSDPLLSLQMRHQVEVRSRIVGEPQSMDRSPAVLEVLIDKTPPDVAFGKNVKNGALEVDISDVVSPKTAITVRFSLDDEPLGKPILAEALASIEVGEAATLKVEATDEEGNVASVSHSLIRGKQDKSQAAESACNCSVPGSGDRNAGRFGLGALFLLGLGLLSRRRRSAARRPFALDARRARVLVAIPLMAIGLSWSGCSCGDESEGSEPSDGGNDAKPPGSCPEGDTCSQILPGLVGAYASAAVDSDGAIWVAAYDDIGYEVDPDGVETSYLFGDLVVGKWDGTKVDWQVVDGLPAEPSEVDPFLYDITGFRFGITEPGDDVGLWTSIAIEGNSPRIAYFDAKNRALKYAEQSAGTWRTHTVEQITDGEAGRYAKLLFVDGKPVIAYMAVRPGTGTDGFSESAVRVATGKSASPAAASDWTFADAVVDPQSPCNAYTCGAEECRSDTLKCQATTTGCDPKCASGEKCFDEAGAPTCVVTVTPSSLVAYPDGIGLYVSLASTPTGLGIAYYDRNHGNLIAVREDSGTWQPPVIVDGQGTGPNGPIDTGDVGIGTSLHVDAAGDWHISYANGFDESLRYIKVTAGTTPGTSEIVDDGVTTDGNAVVGDDTSIHVTGTGEVQIAYQNATHGEARWATGAPNGATHTWTKKTLTVSDFAGGFNQVLDVGGQTQVLTWWRRGVPRTEGDITIVTP